MLFGLEIVPFQTKLVWHLHPIKSWGHLTVETLNICLNKLKSNFHFFLFSLTGLQTNQCDLYFWRLLRILIPISQESAGRKSWGQTKKDNLFLYFKCFKKKLLMRKKILWFFKQLLFKKVDSLVASSFFLFIKIALWVHRKNIQP